MKDAFTIWEMDPLCASFARLQAIRTDPHKCKYSHTLLKCNGLTGPYQIKAHACKVRTYHIERHTVTEAQYLTTEKLINGKKVRRRIYIGDAHRIVEKHHYKPFKDCFLDCITGTFYDALSGECLSTNQLHLEKLAA